MKDYYKILQIDKMASEEVIKVAYKALAKKYHPDNWKGKEQVANQMFSEIREAYEVLSDSERRKEYDTQYKDDAHKDTQYNCQEESSEVKKESEFSNNTECGKTESKLQQSKLWKVLKTIGSEFKESLERQQKEIMDAYYRGQALDDSVLIKRYMQSVGTKRAGYQKAMVERGILYKNDSGNYLITGKYKKYFH